MPSDFLTSTVLYWSIVAASEFGSAYAGYLAFSVWRGLSVPIYRSRALWTGILAFFFCLGFPVAGDISKLFPPNYTYIAATLAYFVLFPGFVIAFFAWIDRTVTILIRMDYFRRDLAGWNKIRWVFRGCGGATAVTAWLYSAYASPSVSSIQREQFFSDVYLDILFLIPLVYGSVALVIGSRRTPDMTFQTHAKWLGYTTGAVFLSFLLFGLTVYSVLGAVPFLLISFSFYKVARSLVPVGKLQTDRRMGETSLGIPAPR